MVSGPLGHWFIVRSHQQLTTDYWRLTTDKLKQARNYPRIGGEVQVSVPGQQSAVHKTIRPRLFAFALQERPRLKWALGFQT